VVDRQAVFSKRLAFPAAWKSRTSLMSKISEIFLAASNADSFTSNIISPAHVRLLQSDWFRQAVQIRPKQVVELENLQPLEAESKDVLYRHRIQRRKSDNGV
jgi:hypothetical protein